MNNNISLLMLQQFRTNSRKQKNVMTTYMNNNISLLMLQQFQTNSRKQKNVM